MGVHQKDLAARQHQAIHAGVYLALGAVFCALALADDLVDVLQMDGGGTPGATNQAVHIAFVQQHGANQRQAAAHFDLGHLRGNALTRRHLVVSLPKITVTVVLFHVHYAVVHTLREAQTKFFDPLGNHFGAANQRRKRQALVHHNLCCPQYALVFTFSVGHAFLQGFFGRVKDGLHRGARGIHKTLQALAVGVHVGNRAQGYATVRGGLGHRWRDFHHQARIKRLGDQVFGAKGQLLAHVGRRNYFALLGLGQLGNGVHCGNFHL